MRPADRRFVQAEHLPNLLHVQFLLVVEREDEFFALGQGRYRFRKRRHHSAAVERRVLIFHRPQPVIVGFAQRVDVQESDAGDLDQHRMVLAEFDAHFGGDLVVAAVAAETRLDCVQCLARGFGKPHDPHRRPDLATRLINHRVDDGALQRLVGRRHRCGVAGETQHRDQTRLDQIVELDSLGYASFEAQC